MTLKEELTAALDEAVKPVKLVGGKKGENTPIENCKAKNPMLCPYHGAGKIAEFLNSKSAKGLKFNVEKKGNGKYAISCTYPKADYDFFQDASNCIAALQKINGFKSTGINKANPSDDVDDLDVFSNELSMNDDDQVGGMLDDIDVFKKDAFGGDGELDDDELEDRLFDLDIASKEDEPDYDTLNELYDKAQVLFKYKGNMDAVEDMGMDIAAADADFDPTFDELTDKLTDALMDATDAFPNGTIPHDFPGIHSFKDAKLALNGDKVQLTGAKANFFDALEGGDLYTAKKALSLLDDAAQKYKDAYDLYKKHVDAMSENFGKCYGEKDWKNVPLTYPKELLTNPGDKAENVPGQQSEQTPNKESLLNLWLVTHGTDLLKYHGLKATKANKAALAEEMKQLLDEGKLNPHFNSDGIIASSITNGDVTDADLLADFFEHMKSGKPKTSKSKKTDEPTISDIKEVKPIDLPEEMLKPLEHDASKFPQGISQDELEAAYAKGKALGGSSGDQAKKVVIGDKTYVMKAGSGKHAAHIHNEILADQAYRAGGVLAPDCQEYAFDGKTYKLAEFIEGKQLASAMSSATDEQKDAIRADLLKGYPLDCLFSNWDVLGTGHDNVIVDKDGHCWRVDNGGSFNCRAKSNKKDLSACKSELEGKVDFEDWDEKGGWDKREWPDDWRTMRRSSINAGVFDQYTTHQIFNAASNINFSSAISGLPTEIKEALAKPLFNMRAMVTEAKGAKVAAYAAGTSYSFKDAKGKEHTLEIDMVSEVLDTLYDSFKYGAREFLEGQDTLLKDPKSKVKPFSKPKPQPIQPPSPGSDYAQTILKAVKSISFHIDHGDFTPNQGSIKEALALKPVLQQLEKDGNQKAKGLLEAIAKIEDAGKNGYKSKLTFSTPNGMFDTKGLSLVSNEKEVNEVNKTHAAEIEAKNKEIAAWEKENAEYLKKQQKKVISSGGKAFTGFADFCKFMVERNGDTNGIAQNNGSNAANAESKSGQKHTSFCTNSCKKKVRQYAMMGLRLEDMFFKNTDKKFYNGHTDNGGQHVSGWDTDEKDYFAAVKFYQDNPEQLRKDLQGYCKNKAMMVLLHRFVDSPAVDKKTGTVFVIRSEHPEAWGPGGANAPSVSKSKIIPPYPIDCSPSIAVEGYASFGKVPIAWKIPVWRFNDNYAGSEQEINANPIDNPYPPMVIGAKFVHNLKEAMEQYNGMEEVKAINDKMEKTMMPY